MLAACAHERWKSPNLFYVVMRCWLRPLGTAWKERRQGYKSRTGTTAEDDEVLKSLVIFPDKCDTLASSRSISLEVAHGATEKIVQCHPEWKTNEMQFACWRIALDETDVYQDCKKSNVAGTFVGISYE